MKRSVQTMAFFASCAVFLASCLSAPPAAPASGPNGSAAASKDSLQTMREMRAAAQSAFDSNHPVEALRHLVALLAADGETPPETDPARAAERSELVRRADAELTAIGARFVLEPTDEWVSDGKQMSGNVRDLAKGAGL